MTRDLTGHGAAAGWTEAEPNRSRDLTGRQPTGAGGGVWCAPARRAVVAEAWRCEVADVFLSANTVAER